LLGGFGPGLLATGLTAALTALFVLPLDTPQNVLGVFIYLFTDGLIVGTAAALRKTLRAVERHARAAAASEALLRMTGQRLNALLESAPVGINFSDDASCERIRGNPEALAQFEANAADNLSPSAPDAAALGRRLRFFRDSRELTAADLPLHRAVRENAVVAPMQIEVELPDGRRWTCEARGAPVRDVSGAIIGGIAITADITERRRSEERIQLLLGEINHRSKNLLSVVQSIARQTMKGTDPKSFIDVFEKRLAGLAASQDLLVGSEWVGVDLEALIRSQLSHYRGLLDSRILLAGGPCRIGPAAAQALGIALHELGVNAAKYGALSGEAGIVQVDWELTGDGRARRLRLGWRETGGPAPLIPERRGFGHTVLVQMVRHALAAEVTLDYPQEGLIWEMSALAAPLLEDPAAPHP
jgi:two-component sensor histidine kinase/PAS domain-containing protein